MESGQIARWNKKVGDEFIAGDILCEVQTDKATVDFEAQDDGIIARIIAEAGPNDVQCGEPIMITVEDVNDVGAFKDYKVKEEGSGSKGKKDGNKSSSPSDDPVDMSSKSAAEEAPSPQPPTLAPPSPSSTTESSPSTGRIVASPLAHKLAKEMGKNIASVSGTGPGGRIIADDVREYVPSQQQQKSPSHPSPQSTTSTTADGGKKPPKPSPSTTTQKPPPPIVGAGYTDFPLSENAQMAAVRLVQSKRNVPHYYLMADIHLDAILKLRSSLNQAVGANKKSKGDDYDDDDNVKSITLNDMLIKAAACAMKTVPSANASWMDSYVRVYNDVNINIHMGSGDGLYTPLLRNVETSGIMSISQRIAEMRMKLGGNANGEKGKEMSAECAEDCAVGTFSVINLGMYGIKSCAPIIMEPQACMLALGSAENRIIPNDDAIVADGGGDASNVEIYKEAVMLTATLSCDHRVVDGAVGAQWLSAFKSHVENPSTLLL